MLRPRAMRQMGSLELVTAPTTEPVTRDEAKAHARIETTADDTIVDSLIVAARELVERLTGRALISQTWRLVMDNWPGYSIRDDWWDGVRDGALTMLATDEIEIRKAPFLAITSVITYDEDGTANTYDSGNYYALTDWGFGRLVKKVGQVWPIMAPPARQRGGIVITFTAGYGTTAANVPMGLRQCVKDLVAHWYENRGAADESSRYHVPMKTQTILQQFTVGR